MKFFEKDNTVAYIQVYYSQSLRAWNVKKQNKIFDQIGDTELIVTTEEKDKRVAELKKECGL